MEKSSKKVCVTGGAGYIGSWLIKKLLEKGYIVHATLRNLNDESKAGFLKSLPYADTRLVLFQANIYNPDEFQPAIEGCDFVIHVATPKQHTENDKYKNTSEAAIEGVKRIALCCIKSGTVRRLVYTASVVAASPMKDDGTGYKDSVDETCWTPLDHSFAYSNEYLRAYTESKTLSEREILSYDDVHFGGLEVVSLACGLVGGDIILPYVPSSLSVCISPFTGNEDWLQRLRYLDEILGKVPIVHIDDVCEAHIFCIEHPSLHGRFLCASSFVSFAEIAEYYKENYPGNHHLRQEDMVEPKKEIKWGSTKLLDNGFKYKYGTKDILDGNVKVVKRIGDI